jgi:hypothetical protein
VRTLILEVMEELGTRTNEEPGAFLSKLLKRLWERYLSSRATSNDHTSAFLRGVPTALARPLPVLLVRVDNSSRRCEEGPSSSAQTVQYGTGTGSKVRGLGGSPAREHGQGGLRPPATP